MILLLKIKNMRILMPFIATFILIATGESASADDAQRIYKTGKLLYERHDFHRALSQFDRCIAIRPAWADAYFERGRTYFLLGKPQKAVKDLSKAISLNSRHADSYVWRAKAYHELGQIQKGIDDCTSSISINPKADNPYMLRGKLLCAIEQDKKAIDDYRRAALLSPGNPDVYFERGNACLRLKQYKQAIEDFTKAINLQARQTELIYANRALAYEKIGRSDLAAKDRTILNKTVEANWGAP